MCPARDAPPLVAVSVEERAALLENISLLGFTS